MEAEVVADLYGMMVIKEQGKNVWYVMPKSNSIFTVVVLKEE
jgi:hypothetical protein